MTYAWPQGWVPIYCECDALIGGYPQRHQPDRIEIHHRCTPTMLGYYVTVINK